MTVEPLWPLAEIAATGVRVTHLGLGCAPLGGLFESVSETDAAATVHAAYRLGLRYFDTAPYYGHGRSELRLGEALRDYPRDSYTISSKVGRRLIPAEANALEDHQYRDCLAFNPCFDFTEPGIKQALEQSLERLRLDHLDIAFLHDPDDHFEVALNEAIPAMLELKQLGLIRAVGVGMNQSEMLAEFVARVPLDCVLLAGRYTLLDQSALAELLPSCEQKGVDVVLGGPFNSGILATGSSGSGHYDYEPPPTAILDKLERLEQACQDHGVSLQAAALQFPRAHPAIQTIIPGARSSSEVSSNAAQMDAPIPDGFWRAIRNQGLVEARAPLPSGS